MMDTYLVKYNLLGTEREERFNESEASVVKAFVNDRLGLTEFTNIRIYKLCNDEIMEG